MAKGGFRKKMNLDLTPEEFSSLSLREENEILDRLDDISEGFEREIDDLFNFSRSGGYS